MAILSAIEVGFRSKKTLHGVEEGERQMVKKRGLAEEGPGRRPPRRSRGQRASPAETARRAVWPAARPATVQLPGRLHAPTARPCQLVYFLQE